MKLWRMRNGGSFEELSKINQEAATDSLAEAFGESAPQLLFQLSVIFSKGKVTGKATGLGPSPIV